MSVDIDDGITEIGRVDHSDIARDIYCDDPQEEYVSYECEHGSWVWGGAPSRSVVMTDDNRTYLYSVSRIGVKASELEEIDTTLGVIDLPTKGYGWWWY